MPKKKIKYNIINKNKTNVKVIVKRDKGGGGAAASSSSGGMGFLPFGGFPYPTMNNNDIRPKPFIQNPITTSSKIPVPPIIPIQKPTPKPTPPTAKPTVAVNTTTGNNRPDDDDKGGGGVRLGGSDIPPEERKGRISRLKKDIKKTEHNDGPPESGPLAVPPTAPPDYSDMPKLEPKPQEDTKFTSSSENARAKPSGDYSGQQMNIGNGEKNAMVYKKPTSNYDVLTLLQNAAASAVAAKAAMRLGHKLNLIPATVVGSYNTIADGAAEIVGSA